MSITVNEVVSAVPADTQFWFYYMEIKPQKVKF